MTKKTEKTEVQAVNNAKETATKAKNTIPEVQETPPKVDTGTPAGAPESPPEAKETRKRYIFPRQGDIKCPACGLYETVATSSPQGPIQWRRCTRAIPRCEHTFKITGTEVKVTDCKQES